MNVPDEVAEARERTITAHLDGETGKDISSLLATFGGEPTYELGVSCRPSSTRPGPRPTSPSVSTPT
jgi:hypothetical protein